MPEPDPPVRAVREGRRQPGPAGRSPTGSRTRCTVRVGKANELPARSTTPMNASSTSSQGGALLAFAATTAERALGAYAEALRIDPQNETALSHLTRLCRRLGRWDLVLSALAAVPHSLRVLRALAEAAERLERWADVARFKEEELGLLVEPREVLRAARALAELYEQRLQDPESAARVWERAYQASPEESLSMASVPTALARLYTAQGRHRELLALLEQELAHIDGQLSTLPEPRPLGGQSGRNFSGPVGGADHRARRDLSERRRELLLRQAQLLQDPLRDGAAAATRYEQVLADFPDDPQALSALSALYAAEGRQGDRKSVV